MKLVVLVALLLIPIFVDASSSRPLELMAAGDIEDIQTLGVEVDRLVAKIKQCAAAGLAPATQCHCYYPGKLGRAKSTFQSILAKHPEWEDRAVLWWDDTRTNPSNLHMGGVRAQFEQPCT
jgi:hypothetical protein